MVWVVILFLLGVCVLFGLGGFFLNLFLRKFFSYYYKMMSILHTLSLHEKLHISQVLSQLIHLLPTTDTVSNNVHFWWLGMEEGFP